MEKNIIKIVNATTGEEIEREMTIEELEQWEANKSARIARQEAKATKAAERQAILDRLGLTAEEAQLILGGNQ